MHTKLIHAALIAIAIYNVDCKRTRNKKLSDTDNSTPQPSVLTYSNFGFNDVGSYDGFVPSSPDYASFLTGNNKPESSTRLYAPAFPTPLDTSGFSGNYGSSGNGQSQQNPEEELQASMSKYPPVSINFFTSPSFENNNDPYANKMNADTEYDQKESESNSPIYGTKIGSKLKNKHFMDLKSNLNKSAEESLNINQDAYRMQDSYGATETKQLFNEMNNDNYPTIFKITTSTVVPPDYDHFLKTPAVTPSAIKFPRVIDFTNMNTYNENRNNNMKSYHQNDNHMNSYNQNGNNDMNSFNQNNNNNFNSGFMNPDFNSDPYYHATNSGPANQVDKEANKENKIISPWKQKNYFKDEDLKPEKEPVKFNYAENQEFSQNYFNNKSKLKGKYNFYNDKIKKPWNYSSKDEEVKKYKNPIGYQYMTNHSAMAGSKHEHYKRPFNSSIDEISPASSNLDFYNYQHPSMDFGNIPNFAIKPSFGESDHNDFGASFDGKIKNLDDYSNNYKNVFTTLPTITTHWGSLFKPTEIGSYKNHIRKPIYQEDNDEVVHIPKRLTNNKFGSQYDGESFSDGFRPHTSSYRHYGWPKEGNRFKSEEDLLGLRTHDLSHHSHAPYRPYYDDPREDFDYKKLVDKWKQSYLKAKHKDTFREYESYASEAKPVHVPVPRPYPIEIPHPVIVPVPQPYPIHVPVPKPVAVPVIRELSVPIERPVPYPVYKKVPYPVEKPVPVPVEKQVHVPVAKPYPVTVPQVRPLFHHTRPHDDRDPDFEEEDDYQPRPESSKRIPNVKRPKKNPPRRPSRMTYQDRDKRRGPVRRPPARDQKHRHSHSDRRRPSHRYEDYEDSYEPSDYVYCKRTGNC